MTSKDSHGAATEAAEDVFTELIEACVAAEAYVATTEAGKELYAQRFVDHLRRLETTCEALRRPLLSAQEAFRAVATAPVSVAGISLPSAHEAMETVADAACADVTSAVSESESPGGSPRASKSRPRPSPRNLSCGRISTSRFARSWKPSDHPRV